MRPRELAAFAGVLLVAATLALAAADVLFHLELPRRLVSGELPMSRPVDFVGLLLADLPLAALLALAALAGGGVLARLLPGGAYAREVLALLGAGLAFVVVVAGIEMRASTLSPLQLLLVGGAGGAVVWGGLRWRLGSADARSLGSLAATAGPAWVIAGAIGAFDAAARSEGRGGFVAGTLAALGLGVLLGGRFGAPVRSALLALLVLCAIVPVLAALRVPSASFDDLAERPALVGRPHVVLIVLDTVRADRLDLYGHARDTMPALKRWAADGVVARRAVSPAGWTTPAHASMLSGVPVSDHGIHYDADTLSLHTPAREGIDWLPARLAKLGYTTAAISANPLAIHDDVAGFDRVVSPERDVWHERSIGALAAPLFPFLRAASEGLRWRLSYIDAAQVNDVVERAAPPADRPAFLLVNFFDAHAPYDPPPAALDALGLDPPRLFDRYATHRVLTNALADLPPEAPRVVRALYDGELRYLDGHLDALLRFVDARYGKDAVVIVTADHGEELGEDGRIGHEYGLAQSLVHVPLVVRAPWLAPGELAPAVSTRRLADFVWRIAQGERPQLADALAEDADGILAERYRSRVNRELLGADHDRAWVARYEGDTKVVGPSEHARDVYDVARFTDEQAVAPTPASDALADRVDAWWRAHRDPRTVEPDAAEPTQAEIDQLRALGYAE